MKYKANMRGEARNPKPEIRQKSEARNPKQRVGAGFHAHGSKTAVDGIRPWASGLPSELGDLELEVETDDRRFAACVAGGGLLSIWVRTARRAPVSESSTYFHLSAGCHSRDRLTSVSQQSKNTNLTRCEIFRGKVPPRITQN